MGVKAAGITPYGAWKVFDTREAAEHYLDTNVWAKISRTQTMKTEWLGRPAIVIEGTPTITDVVGANGSCIGFKLTWAFTFAGINVGDERHDFRRMDKSAMNALSRKLGRDVTATAIEFRRGRRVYIKRPDGQTPDYRWNGE